MITPQHRQRLREAGYSEADIGAYEVWRAKKEADGTLPPKTPKPTRQSEARGGSDTSFRDLPGNILPSAGRAIKDISSAVIHPVQTAKALGAVGMGVAEKILGD